MEFLFVILAIIAAVFGVVKLIQGDIILGIVLLVVACLLGPGGFWILG